MTDALTIAAVAPSIDMPLVWMIITVVAYIGGGAVIGAVGYWINRIRDDEPFSWGKIRSTLVIGAIAGLIALVFGGELSAVYPISALLIPVADQLWNAFKRSASDAQHAYEEGETLVEILVTFAERMDRETDRDALLELAEEISTVAGPDTSPRLENVKRRAAETRKGYKNEGASGVVPEGVPTDSESAQETADQWDAAMYPDEETARQVDDEALGADEREGVMRAHTADAAPPEPEPAPDKGEHYVGDGDPDDPETEDDPEQEDTDAGGLPPA